MEQHEILVIGMDIGKNRVNMRLRMIIVCIIIIKIDAKLARCEKGKVRLGKRKDEQIFRYISR